jgi:hypothetical protein
MNLLYTLVLLTAVDFMPVRQVEETGMLGDILSHSHKTSVYENPITHFHENVHAANAAVNKEFKRPAVYLGDNKAFVFKEKIPVTVLQIANEVPRSLRDHQSYTWYLVTLPKMNHFNNEFSDIILDEWIAFTLTTEYRTKLGVENDEQEPEYMLAFTVYSVLLCMNMNPDDTVIEFYKEQLDKVKQVYKESRSLPHTKADAYLKKFLLADDCAHIRKYMEEELEFEFR